MTTRSIYAKQEQARHEGCERSVVHLLWLEMSDVPKQQPHVDSDGLYAVFFVGLD